MTYLTKVGVQKPLERMSVFFKELESLYFRNGIDLLDDVCRRNNLMSAVQERFFADALGETLEGVYHDGQTGAADIVIGELNTELECKLTSPRADKTISLQTDFATLERKGSLDYLYVIANADFNRFCVLLFEGLTTEDFHTPYTGSRGKAQMNKALAMDKCHVLWGKSVDVSQETISRMEKRLAGLSERAIKTREKVVKQISAQLKRPTRWRFEMQEL
jgi:hypothetical protein